MNEKLSKIKENALAEITRAKNIHELDEIDQKYFGRKSGILNEILRGLKNLPEAERRRVGNEANRIKSLVQDRLAQKNGELKQEQKERQFVDLTSSTSNTKIGRLHPITLIKKEIEDVFIKLGYGIVSGPEIETDYYNFESLNMPEEHPARDMWDTFYVKQERKEKTRLLLRTHISPVQVRIMEKHKPPFAVISSGRVFRHEATDARHEHTYDYTEGFFVGENASLSQLKWTLSHLFRSIFGNDVEIKFLPSYFPFTEPSLELSMGCIFCNKKGCSVCHTGWLEMLGAGMIHPKVFEHAGYEKGRYSGFAFGIGISRVAMLKYNIPDIRLLYQNDLRLLNQF
jgi:phenylalanyl-tRNA synthetase alpha chain